MEESQEVGRRLRELRSWRQLSLKLVADLAGVSYGYFAQIERGEKPVTKRSTLELLANALRVSPAELTGKPWAPTDAVSSAGHAALAAIESSLEASELGDDPGGPLRPWPELASDVRHLIDLTHVNADYAAQGELVPKLLAELHSAYVREPENRRDVSVRALCGRTFASGDVERVASVGGMPCMACVGHAARASTKTPPEIAGENPS